MSPKIAVRVLTSVTAGMLAISPIFSQSRGGAAPTSSTPTSTGAGAGSTASPTVGRTPSVTTNPTTTTPQPNIQQPIFLSGRVMLDDGTPPAEPVVIESTCGASRHAEGYTDAKGYFSIQFGKRLGVLQDASESQGFGGFGNAGVPGMPNAAQSDTAGSRTGNFGSELRLANCELHARLAGFRSQSVGLANHRPMDNPDIGVILLHRIGENEGTTVSASSLAAPKDARKAFDKGMEALKKGKPDDANRNFQKAADLYPGYATAWFELGRNRLEAQDYEGARKCFDQAAKADPKYVAPLVEIAALDARAQHWRDLAETTERAARLDAFDYPQIFLMNAVAKFNLRDLDAAEKSARQAEKLDTRHQFPKTWHLLGIIMAQRHDFASAAEEFRTYLTIAPNAPDAAEVRSQLEQVEKITAQK